MINSITNSHHNITSALSNVVSAKQFLDSDRPLVEVLSLVDNSLSDLHNAKTELLKLRETLRQKKLEQDSQ